MKHPSRWPWLLRAPLCMSIILVLWWGPIFLLLYGLSVAGAFKALGETAGLLLGGGVLIGWSEFIMRTVVHRHIEPFFNFPSLQNPHKDRFTPEQVHSFREWLQLMFLGK